MMKGLIEWTEAEISRGRKIVMFNIVFFFILITMIIMFLAFIDSVKGFDRFYDYYKTFSVLAGAVVAFYTATTPGRTIGETFGFGQRAIQGANDISPFRGDDSSRFIGQGIDNAGSCVGDNPCKNCDIPDSFDPMTASNEDWAKYYKRCQENKRRQNV